MVVRHTFTGLMDLISNHLVPPFIAEHVFAHKNEIADAMQQGEPYQFKSPTGEIIRVEWDENAK